MFSIKSIKNLAIATFTLLLWQNVVVAQQVERYIMDGKEVSRSEYEGILLLKEGLKKLRANDNLGAIQSFKHAESLAPDVPQVHHNLGIALAKSGKTKEAIMHLEKARQLDPNLAATWLSLAGLYQIEGRINDALTTYKQYLKKFPGDPASVKVQNLVKGLTKEANLESNIKSNVPESKDNYLREVTRQGFMKWSKVKMPLRIYIAPGDSTPGYKQDYKNLLVQSFDDWQKACDGLITFKFVENDMHSDIQCSWTNNPKDLRNPAEAGECNLFSNKNGIVRGTIKFLTVPLMKTLPITKNRMRTTCLHEIGHVLGLAGHTRNPEDVMFYSVGVKDQWRNLTKRDANTIKKLYTSNQSL